MTQTDQQNQALLMQQVYANYMTQYVRYLQSIGALNSGWPNPQNQSLIVDQTNQIADEARAGGGAAPQFFDHVHAAAAVAGAAVAVQQPAPAQPAAQQPMAQAQNVQNEVINQVPVGADNNNMGPNGPNVVMNAGMSKVSKL